MITGVVGAAGGLGGFFLPNILGGLRQWNGTFTGGFVLFSLIGALSAVTLVVVSKGWAFVGEGGRVEPIPG